MNRQGVELELWELSIDALGPWEAPAAAEWLSVYRAVRRSHTQPELSDTLVFYPLQPTKERPVLRSWVISPKTST